ncbi:MAG: uracil-DNA glycosylase [Chloroflexi bacterium]|nr:uracil-DNA glycosylase [Chloroflexota bacterium]
MATRATLDALNAAIVACRRCPRLVAYREAVARRRKPQFATWTYWGRPVPGVGDARARVLLVGLAPAAHGANRTGRMFTGDGSGDFLTAALYRAGLTSSPRSRSRDDGLRYRGVYLTAAVRCAPPDNRPAPQEISNCLPYLVAELRLLRRVRVVVALGSLAHRSFLRAAEEIGIPVTRPLPRFAHGALTSLTWGGRNLVLLDTYHPSRQNTQTGRLNRTMLDAVFRRARALAAV